MHIYSLLRWTLIPALYLSYDELNLEDTNHLLSTFPFIFSLGLIGFMSYHNRYYELFYSVCLGVGIQHMMRMNTLLTMKTYLIWTRFLLITCYRMVMITCLLYIIQSFVAFAHYYNKYLWGL